MADSSKGRITLFGTFHVDRLSKVEEELTIVSEGCDVIFEESAHPKSGRGDEIRCFLRNPAARSAILCLDILWTLSGLLITQSLHTVDGVAIKRVTERNGVPVKPIDGNVIKPLGRVSLPVSLASWAWFAFTSFLFILGIWKSPSSFELAIVLLFSGYVLSFAGIIPILFSTLDGRDAGMVKNSNMWFEKESFESACIVVGNGHVEEIESQLREAGFEISNVYKSRFLRRNPKINRQKSPPPKSPPSSR